MEVRAGRPGVDRTALRLTRARALVLVGAFLAASGSIGPWVELSARPFVEETVTVYGTDGEDGVATLIAAIVIAGIGLLGFRAGRWRSAPVATLVLAAFVTFVAAVDLLNFDTRVADFEPNGSSLNASLEVGIYLVFVGGATAIVGSALFLNARRRATP